MFSKSLFLLAGFFYIKPREGGRGGGRSPLHGCMAVFPPSNFVCSIYIYIMVRVAHVRVRVSIVTIFHSNSILLKNTFMALYISDV